MTVKTGRGPVVLAADEVDALPEQRLGDIDGVAHRVTWRSESSLAGVLTVAAGHHLGAHTHRENHHHLWVVEGHVDILGKRLGPGSYVHIPSGVDHDIDATATEGCTVFYLYLHAADGEESHVAAPTDLRPW